MESMSSLLAPNAIAVVGASQRLGRGSKVISNLRNAGFKGEIFAVNPRYDEVLGCKCYAAVTDLPATVDCLVLATAADTACDVLEQAFAHGIRAAIVLSAGFGEGGHGPGQARAQRLRSLRQRECASAARIAWASSTSRPPSPPSAARFPEPLRAGPVALVSQSGGLGLTTFSPLMADRDLGFGYFVSCGNQIGTTIEDYVEHFLDDPSITVIAIVVESLKNPQKLQRLGRSAQHAAEIDRAVPGRPLRRRAHHDPVAYWRAGQQFRDPRCVPAALRNRPGRDLRRVRRDDRIVCHGAARPRISATTWSSFRVAAAAPRAPPTCSTAPECRWRICMRRPGSGSRRCCPNSAVSPTQSMEPAPSTTT